MPHWPLHGPLELKLAAPTQYQNVRTAQVQDLSTVLTLDPGANPLPTPVTLNDYTSKVGWNAGACV